MHIHNQLHHFWSCSEGIWVSKLVNVVVNLLNEQELLAISKIHLLDEVEFGVKMSWKYNTKEESGQMSWCVDSYQPGFIFTDTGLTNPNPHILNYQMVDDNRLIITYGKLEETFFLASDTKRLRELRCEGKLVRRLWENKICT